MPINQYRVQAEKLAKKAHGNQKDKIGRHYFNGHIQEVVAMTHGLFGFDDDLLAVAYLHDVVEDTDVTIPQLWDEKFSPNIVESVELLTKKPTQSQDDYLRDLFSGYYDEAPKVKLADTICNMKNLPALALHDPETAERLRYKYSDALRFLSRGLFAQELKLR